MNLPIEILQNPKIKKVEIYRSISIIKQCNQTQHRYYKKLNLEFIENKYKFKTPATKKKSPLRNEPFVGMWKNRPEMKDSVEYVRKLRNTQSLRKHS